MLLRTAGFINKNRVLFLAWPLMAAVSLVLNLYDLRSEILREAT